MFTDKVGQNILRAHGAAHGHHHGAIRVVQRDVVPWAIRRRVPLATHQIFGRVDPRHVLNGRLVRGRPPDRRDDAQRLEPEVAVAAEGEAHVPAHRGKIKVVARPTALTQTQTRRAAPAARAARDAAGPRVAPRRGLQHREGARGLADAGKGVAANFFPDAGGLWKSAGVTGGSGRIVYTALKSVEGAVSGVLVIPGKNLQTGVSQIFYVGVPGEKD